MKEFDSTGPFPPLYSDREAKTDRAMTDTDTIAKITSLEAARCRALVANDLPALAALLSEDLVHVHTTGAVENKAQYLAGVEKRLQFLSAERRDLAVRVYGGIAIATGRLDQAVRVRATGQERRLEAVTTQVWRNVDGRWLICSFHACLANPPK
jgi:ketosteroid isomerase-like protein